MYYTKARWYGVLLSVRAKTANNNSMQEDENQVRKAEIYREIRNLVGVIYIGVSLEHTLFSVLR